MSDYRRSAPHVARNTAPIIDVLRDVLPERGMVLEIASGTGEQVLEFARAFPKLLWQPSDTNPTGIRSIEGWRAATPLFNLLPPVSLDARAAGWPIASAEAIVCINMVHISPWTATEGLLRGAGRLLESGAPLFLYGPYLQGDAEVAPSNRAFDESLKSRNPEWGLREVAAVEQEAGRHGLALERITTMPANNLSLIFRRR